MSFIPKRDVREGGMSDLERFRMSPIYRAMLKKRVRGQGLLVQNYLQKRANLVEAAKKYAQQEGSFSDALIARLMEAGLERALVDVLPAGPGCSVIMSDRIGRLSKEIKDIVAEIAESEQVGDPDDTGNGTYIFQIMPKDGVDFADYLQKMLTKGEKKNESVDPSFRPNR